MAKLISTESIISDIINKIRDEASDSKSCEDDMTNSFEHASEGDLCEDEGGSCSDEGYPWNNWLPRIQKEVSNFKDVGNDVNPYYLPKLRKQLFHIIPIFPLWSCVVYDRFRYGRIPASSLALEGEFNKIKTVNFPGKNRKKRIDHFIKDNISYFNGRAKLSEAHLNDAQNIPQAETNEDGTLEKYKDGNREEINTSSIYASEDASKYLTV